MSYTTYYSSFRSKEDLNKAPQIINKEAFIDFFENNEMSHLLVKGEQWGKDVVHGLKTWKIQTALYELNKYGADAEFLFDESNNGFPFQYNINRFGIGYGTTKDEIADFFKELGVFLEPFIVLMGVKEHTLFDVKKVMKGEPFMIYCIEVEGEKCIISKLEIKTKSKIEDMY